MHAQSLQGLDLSVDRIDTGEFQDVVVQTHSISQVVIHVLLLLQAVLRLVRAIEPENGFDCVPQGCVQPLVFDHRRCKGHGDRFFRSIRKGTRHSLKCRRTIENKRRNVRLRRPHVLLDMFDELLSPFRVSTHVPRPNGSAWHTQFVCRCCSSDLSRFDRFLRTI